MTKLLTSVTIAVGAVVLLAAVVLLTAARKSDVRGAGALSRETRRRDRDADIDLPPSPTGRPESPRSRRTIPTRPTGRP